MGKIELQDMSIKHIVEMGQYYLPVFLGDSPRKTAAVAQKKLRILEKMLLVKRSMLDFKNSLEDVSSTVTENESELSDLHTKIEQLKSTPATGEFIRAWLNPHAFSNGVKLTEHAYAVSKTVQTAIFHLSPEGHFYRTRLVWAGDYADPEPDDYIPRSEDHGECKTLDSRAYDQPEKCLSVARKTTDTYIYFVNHDKQEYVDLRPFGNGPHPIPLLTAEGNGRGGGDYRGNGREFVGIWARDVVSVDKEIPEGFILRDDIVFNEDD